MTTPPERIELPAEILPRTMLRRLLVTDADAVAHAVGENLHHLRPWMAWADNGSADPAFQRDRLRGVADRWTSGEEYQYGLFAPDDDATLLGSFGLMTRRGRGTLEIGYWLAGSACGRGYATHATAALTDLALAVRGVKQSLIYTDAANIRSAAIPKRLGYELLRVDEEAPTAPNESGRTQVWLRTTPINP